MLDHHLRVDTAADVEIRRQPQEAGVRGSHQILQDPVGDRLVEGALVTERPHVELQGFQFDAADIGNVLEVQRGEVRLAGLRAQAGELRHRDTDGIIAARIGVLERLQLPARARSRAPGTILAHRVPCSSYDAPVTIFTIIVSARNLLYTTAFWRANAVRSRDATEQNQAVRLQV